MSTEETAKREDVGWHVGGLVFFGGLSIGVNIWHAVHSAHGNSLPIALVVGVVPPAIAAFMSHDMAKGRKVGKWTAVICAVFAIAMGLSINAQARTVEPYVGGYLSWLFPVMIDLATFYSLSRLTVAAKAATEAPAESPAGAPAETFTGAPAAPPVGAPAASPARRLPNAPAAPPVKAPAAPPARRPKTTRKATATKPKMSPAEVKAKVWELLKENPEMSAPALAVELGKSPKSGHVRDLKAKVLEEMRDAGELPSVRAIGA
jgi:hypothetical protein